MAARALRDAYDSLLVDLDGVVYVGPHAVPGAVETLDSAREAGLGVAYLTNNASRAADEVAVHLRQLGLSVTADDVMTSAQVAARMVAEQCGSGARVLAVGGAGVASSLRAEGLVPVASADDEPVAVVQGYGPAVGWSELAEATFAIRAGALWVATNTDLTIPTPRGVAPGNGTLVAAVRSAVGMDPLVAGKPQPEALRHAARRIGARRPLVLGDRLDTDIEGGRAAGMETLLVLTGVHGLADAAVAPPSQRPDVVVATLRSLAGPVAPVTVDGDRAACGAAVVEVRGTEVCERTPSDDPLESARAALELFWTVRDSGRDVRVPDHLFDAVPLGR